MDNPTKCKIVLLGDQSVGKTSVINRFIFDNFTGNQQPTVGVDFVSKTVNVDNKVLRMQLWDTAGQQRFHSLIPSYIKDCSAAIIVFDLTSQSSFNNLNRWAESVKQIRGQQALIMILGNKLDLRQQRQIDKATFDAKVKQLNLRSAEVSAKTGEGVAQFFKQLAATIALGDKKTRQAKQRKNMQPTIVPEAQVQQKQPTVSLNNKSHVQSGKAKKKGGCC